MDQSVCSSGEPNSGYSLENWCTVMFSCSSDSDCPMDDPGNPYSVGYSSRASSKKYCSVDCAAYAISFLGNEYKTVGSAIC
jgi:hypothetical protein